MNSDLKEKLYQNSNLHLDEFLTLFDSLLSRLHLSETQAESILEFVRVILPDNNKLPESYYRFKSLTKTNLIKQIKLCNLCKKELVNGSCPNDSCGSSRIYQGNKNLISKKSIKIIEADLKSQIEIVLLHHYEHIVKYKSIHK